MYCPLYTAGRRKHLNASGRPRKPPSTFQPSDARSLAAMFFRENWCLRDAAHGVGAEMSGIMGIYLETRSGCHARHTTTIVHYTLLPLMILIESTTSTGLSGTETVRCAVRRGSVWICAAHTDHFVCEEHVHTDNAPHIQTTLYVRDMCTQTMTRTYRPLCMCGALTARTSGAYVRTLFYIYRIHRLYIRRILYVHILHMRCICHVLIRRI
jgi:hypothetical protein